MNKLELTSEQIINLIFEKKISSGDYSISAKDSCLTILAELDTRLNDGKFFNRKNTNVCGPDSPKKDVYRRQSSYERA